jgi:plasmid stabilization system protein ParE
MTQIRWSQAARGDVRGIRRYIAQDSPFYARQFCERLVAVVDKLADMPRIGRPVPEAAEATEEIRELIFRDYRILYWVEPDADRVQILAVIHGARDLAGMDKKPWE